MDPHASAGDRFGDIAEEVKRLAAVSAKGIAVYLIIVIAVGVASDLGIALGNSFMSVIITIGAGFFLTKYMIEAGGLAQDGSTRSFWTYLGIAILTGLGIGFGLLFLLLPGLYLAVRWAPIYGYGMAHSSGGVGMAFTAAWESTRDHTVPISIAMLFPLAGFLIGMGIFATLPEVMDTGDLAGSIIGNGALEATSVAFTLIGLAVYSLLARPETEIAEVFE